MQKFVTALSRPHIWKILAISQKVSCNGLTTIQGEEMLLAICYSKKRDELLMFRANNPSYVLIVTLDWMPCRLWREHKWIIQLCIMCPYIDECSFSWRWGNQFSSNGKKLSLFLIAKTSMKNSGKFNQLSISCVVTIGFRF